MEHEYLKIFDASIHIQSPRVLQTEEWRKKSFSKMKLRISDVHENRIQSTVVNWFGE